jgi:heptosyltransferase-2
MNNILIIQTAFIGDVILATALVEELHMHNSSASIDFMLRKGNEYLLAGHPFINKIIIWDKRKQKYSGLFSVLRSIRNEKYDLVINFQRFASTGLLTALSKAKQTRGFNKNPFSFLFSHSIEHQIDIANNFHETDRNHLLIKDITGLSKSNPRLFPSQEDYRVIQPYVSAPFITISPTSVWYTKQYPFVKWIEFIGKIPGNTMIYLLGGKEDLSFCERLSEQCNDTRISILAGKLTLLQSAALMQSARMNYVNDSAPLHLASAGNSPVCAIFCSTIPSFGFGPLSDQSVIVQTNDTLPCRPCGLHGLAKCPEKHFKCALSIDSDQLVNAMNPQGI